MRKADRPWRWGLLVQCAVCSLFGLLAACDGESSPPLGPKYSTQPLAGNLPLYRLAVHPLHNPKKMSESYQPLIDYLNQQLPEARFELEASRNYQAFEDKLRSRDPALVLPNPWQALMAMEKGYRVIAMAGDAEDFRGIFIVRRDSSIRKPTDLRGKAVSYPSPTALAAAMMPQYYLHQHGLKVVAEIDNRYVGSQESSIMSAYLGETDAAATWPPPWRAFQREHPAEAAELRVIWETRPLLNNAFMVRDDVPPALRDKLQALLLDLGQSEAGRNILAGIQTARFHRADNAFYEPVRRFIRRFELEVRPVESK